MICQAFLSENSNYEGNIYTNWCLSSACFFHLYTSYLKNRDLMYAGMPNGWT